MIFDNLQVQIIPKPSDYHYNIGHTDILITWIEWKIENAIRLPVIKRAYSRFKYLIPDNQFERAKQLSAFELRQQPGFYRK